MTKAIKELALLLAESKNRHLIAETDRWETEAAKHFPQTEQLPERLEYILTRYLGNVEIPTGYGNFYHRMIDEISYTEEEYQEWIHSMVYLKSVPNVKQMIETGVLTINQVKNRPEKENGKEWFPATFLYEGKPVHGVVVTLNVLFWEVADRLFQNHKKILSTETIHDALNRAFLVVHESLNRQETPGEKDFNCQVWLGESNYQYQGKHRAEICFFIPEQHLEPHFLTIWNQVCEQTKHCIVARAEEELLPEDVPNDHNKEVTIHV